MVTNSRSAENQIGLEVGINSQITVLEDQSLSGSNPPSLVRLGMYTMLVIVTVISIIVHVTI